MLVLAVSADTYDLAGVDQGVPSRKATALLRVLSLHSRNEFCGCWYVSIASTRDPKLDSDSALQRSGSAVKFA